jgi:C4-dicarboxylate-specific signal transduction histidine kinase
MYSTETGGDEISGIQNISWLPDYKNWYEKLKAGEIISAEIDLIKQKEKDILEGIHVKSFIMVPILINYFFWGFIGFDDSNKARSWTDFDKHILKTMAGTIGGAIDRFDKEQSLLDTEDELSKNIRQLEISQKELEQATSLLIQNEKLATLGTIASSVAHEINSPLGAILNCAERLNEGDLDEKRSSQNIRLILNAATRCKYVVDKLLVTSRQNPDKEECRIAGVVDDWFELYGKQLELQDIDYKTEIRQNMVVMINYNECSQILTNVILNARDALSETDIGQRTIVLTAYTLEDNAIIEIFNNGPHIPDEYKDKIFEVFFTSKESGKGTGLGLWICKNILDKVNGSISIQNVPEGVVNKIVIPLKKK